MKPPLIALGILALIGPAPAALAAGMQVEPGKWEFKIDSTLPMLMGGAPREHVETHCVDEPEISPEKFMEDSKDCTLSDASSDAKSMSWTITCPNPAGTMKGHAEFHSTGKTLTGSMKMGMSANGQQIDMTHTWDGKHLGPCD